LLNSSFATDMIASVVLFAIPVSRSVVWSAVSLLRIYYQAGNPLSRFPACEF